MKKVLAISTLSNQILKSCWTKNMKKYLYLMTTPFLFTGCVATLPVNAVLLPASILVKDDSTQKITQTQHFKNHTNKEA